MANKNNNENKQKELKNIIIIYSIFAIIIFTLTLLKKYSIINSNFELLFIYIIIATFFLLTIVLLCAKSFSSKEICNSMCINIVGIAILTIWGITIDIKKELIDFSKNATKTEALVYMDVEKDISYHKKRCNVGIEKYNHCYVGDSEYYLEPEPAYYDVTYIYHLQYTVEDEIYKSIYRKQEGGKFSNEQKANSWKPKYKKGDYITIYYNNENPDDVRESFTLGFGMVYFLEVITILFQVIYFIKHKKYMKEVIK